MGEVLEANKTRWKKSNFQLRNSIKIITIKPCSMSHESNRAIPSLYEWMGGSENLDKLFTTFYQKVLDDNLLSPLFKNMSPDHIKRVSHFVAEVFGGPKSYTSEDKGSHAVMVGKHIGKMLTEEKRQR